MGRKAVIDREKLLDIAEALLRAEGAQALTIGGLAAAAGISKGGVQYSFSAKDELVRGLVERWVAQFDHIMEGAEGGPLGFVRRYLEATRESGGLIDAKMAAVMLGYIRDPQNLKATRDWYEGAIRRLSGDAREAQLARVIFLALEGLFLLRVNGLDSELEWEGLVADVEAVLERFAVLVG